MASSIFEMPELLINDDEAEQVGTAAEKVMALYSTEVNPATLAWFGLVAALVMVYGPRIYTIRERWKAEKEERAAKQPPPPPQPNVKPFPRPAPAAAASSPAPPPGPTLQEQFGIGYGAEIAEPG